MNKSMKKLLITSIANVFLILLCAVAVTFAWFSVNQNATGNNISVVVSNGDLCFDYTVYQYIEESNSYTDNGDFNLKPYDMIITSRNEHNAIIIKMEIFGQIIEEHSNFTINLLCSDNQLNTRSLSNVIGLKAGLFTIDSNDAETVYTTAETNFANLSAYKFKTNTKATQVSAAMSNYDNYINNGRLTVYLQINYDNTLAEEFNTITAEDLSSVIENPTITFNSDIYELNISAGA